MIILDRYPVSNLPVSRGMFTRELATRQDRRPLEAQLDMPEIEESFRVSFSEAVRTGRYENLRDAMQAPTAVDERGAANQRLRAYLEIAAL